MDTVCYEGLKPGQTLAGYVVVLLDEGAPVANHTLFPPTEQGLNQALEHASRVNPDRRPAVFALHPSRKPSEAF